MIRLACAADIHCGRHGLQWQHDAFDRVGEAADLLLLAGDLTDMGTVAEAEVLAETLSRVPIPVFAVLGNHDYEADSVADVVQILGQAGVTVLEGAGSVVSVRQTRIGIVGIKGFGGGFKDACGTAFGEPEMKAFMATTHGVAAQIDRWIRSVRAAGATHVVAMTHYSPCRDTLLGEKPEIFPFLGSYLLAEPMDRHGIDLAIHGHAHAGQEFGQTDGGVPVRNVAQAVLRRPYAVYTVGRGREQAMEASRPLTPTFAGKHAQH
ncbi:MAG: metallophosphoesterase [Candidatus Sericytochromatia bacterium]|nr:metallophosphoesterase [Candidatus Sericytochromatia bacterium]